VTLVDADILKAEAAAISPAEALIASVDCVGSFEAVEQDWLRLQAAGVATPYQTIGWTRAWCQARAAFRASDRDVEPMIVAARDRRGRAIMILPLAVERRAGLAIASFVGGKHANFNMALFDRGAMERLSRADVVGALRVAAPRRGVDVFRLINQPISWGGVQNPLAQPPSRPGSSSAWMTDLKGDGESSVRAMMSSDSLKKLRNRERKLAEVGPVSYVEARTPAEIDAILSAFFDQKARRFAQMGVPDPFIDETVRAFIRGAAVADGPAISLFAIRAGDRIAAMFGGPVHGGRFSGMFTSFDADPAIARCSPGNLLLLHLVRSFADRGLTAFDLGVGEAAYKKDYCPVEVRLAESILPMTAKGRIAAAAFSAALTAKGLVKRSPALAAALRRAGRFTPA